MHTHTRVTYSGGVSGGVAGTLKTENNNRLKVNYLNFKTEELTIVFKNGMNECLTTPQHEKQIDYWVFKNGRFAKYERYV